VDKLSAGSKWASKRGIKTPAYLPGPRMKVHLTVTKTRNVTFPQIIILALKSLRNIHLGKKKRLPRDAKEA